MGQLTTPEVAGKLGVSDSRVRQLILSGELPAEKKGRDHLVDERDLQRFIDKREAKKKPKE